MQQSTFSARVKALPDEDGQTGRFEAVVAVFGNVDLVGDRVVKGAFEKDLKDWRKSGDPIPVAFAHDWSPFGIIGFADANDVEETKTGLKAIGHLDVDTNPTAAQVHSLMKRRIIKEFSFSYEVKREKKAADGANELLEMKIIEIGPAMKGANPRTELLSVKSAVQLTEANAIRARASDEKRPLTDEEIEFTNTALAEAHEDLKKSLLRATQIIEPDPRVTQAEEDEAALIAAIKSLEPLGEKEEEPATEEKNLYTTIPGSDEERLKAVREALSAWASEEFPVGDEDTWEDRTWVAPVATFEGRAIAEVTKYGEDAKYLEFDYTTDDDGIVTLGDSREVQVTVSVVAEVSAPEAKAEEKTEEAPVETESDESAKMDERLEALKSVIADAALAAAEKFLAEPGAIPEPVEEVAAKTDTEEESADVTPAGADGTDTLLRMKQRIEELENS